MVSRQQRVGFVGLGNMGQPMAARVLRSGFPLTVCPHRNRAPVEALQQLGATVVDDPAAVAAASDVVVTIVPDTPQVEAAVLGERGILAGARRGAVLVDMSTVPPATTRLVAERLADRGVAMLDAPVSGGPARAATGDLTIMVGGDAGVLEEVRAVLEAMGSRIIHLGPQGMGAAAKLANNLLLAGVLVANAEALTLGVKAGIPVDLLRQVMLGGTATNWILENWLPRNVLQGSYEPAGFALQLMHKDISAALAAGRDAGVPLFQAALNQQLFAYAMGEGRGSWDFSAIATVYETGAGIRIATGEPLEQRGG